MYVIGILFTVPLFQLLYILIFFTTKLEEKEQETKYVFPQAISLLPCNNFTITSENYLLIIQTWNVPKGTRNLLPQKMFMVS